MESKQKNLKLGEQIEKIMYHLKAEVAAKAVLSSRLERSQRQTAKQIKLRDPRCGEAIDRAFNILTCVRFSPALIDSRQAQLNGWGEREIRQGHVCAVVEGNNKTALAGSVLDKGYGAKRVKTAIRAFVEAKAV